jgi:hypothetical protein
MDRSARLRGGVRSTFSREQLIYPTLLSQCERLPRTGNNRWKHMSGVRGLTWEAYVSCVSGFPYGVYIDSNRRDFQI